MFEIPEAWVHQGEVEAWARYIYARHRGEGEPKNWDALNSLEQDHYRETARVVLTRGEET